jgi:hypothetical protein
VPPDRQIGREGDIARLAQQLANGEHTVLSDRRRAGKTTVALGALDALATRGYRIVALDLSEAIDDGPGLAEMIVGQIAVQETHSGEAAGSHRLWDVLRPPGGLSGTLADAVDNLVRVMRTSQSAGSYLTWALDLAIDSGKERDGTVIYLDEIQMLESWADHDAVATELRGRLRQPDGNLTFLFAGSEPTLVESLFADRGLLEFDAVRFPLSPIDAQPWREGLRKAFHELGLEITIPAVDLILRSTDGEPHRTMLAANRTAEAAEFAELAEADEFVAEQGVVAARADRLWNAGH